MKKLEVWALKLKNLDQLARLKDDLSIKKEFKIENWYWWEIENKKYVFAFEDGSIVLVGFGDLEYEKLFKRIGPVLVIERYLIEINHSQDRFFNVKDGKVVFSKFSLEAIEVLALVLSMSVSLEYFEEQVEKILDSVNFHQEFLQTRRVKFKTYQMLKIWAQVLEIKRNILNQLYIIDKPDIVWDSPMLEGLYERLVYLYDIQERFEALEYKIDFVNEVVSFVQERLSSRKDHFLERIIILLIAFEIVVYLIELFFKI